MEDAVFNHTAKLKSTLNIFMKKKKIQLQININKIIILEKTYFKS